MVLDAHHKRVPRTEPTLSRQQSEQQQLLLLQSVLEPERLQSSPAGVDAVA